VTINSTRVKPLSFFKNFLVLDIDLTLKFTGAFSSF
jgi:hypothetical protein